MSLLFVLESIFIGPLKLVFEIIYSLAHQMLGNPGLAIIALSLVMNILVLPLYRRADAMQEQARDVENKLSKGVSHIKKTFSGDERMMILQAYYRQNDYKPTDALRGSVSLLLEIPFFMAAYQFLSGMYILDGVSFGPIANLAKPDGLLTIGSVSINVLPFLMTFINILSSALYLKGFPLKTKIQLYGMAAFFLVFLYESPACLVFYWTLNNLFSLVKTVFYKLKNPKKVLKIILAVCTLGISLLASKGIALLGKHRKSVPPQPNKKLFLLGCSALACLTGLMIPASVMGASAQEFVDVFYIHDPMNYLLVSGAMAAGTFLVWFPVFYWLASNKGKALFAKLVAAATIVGMCNYMFFGWHLGIISPTLQYNAGLAYSKLERLLNTAVFLGVGFGGYRLAAQKKNIMASILTIAIIGTLAMTGWNTVKIVQGANAVKAYAAQMESSDLPHFRLSKNGKNVVVIMLDRAVGYYMPYLLAQNPALEEQLDGFTYYSNTISFGGHTNVGTPPLFGGYEYTPVEMNKRDDEWIADKHDEALKVLPVLFSQNGYEVTVCDPPYAGYSWVPDLSIFDEYEGISTYITKGRYADKKQKQTEIQNNYRNFFCFGMMKAMPVWSQDLLYDSGNYRQVYTSTGFMLNQAAVSQSEAKGTNSEFLNSYNVLNNLPGMTQITEDAVNTYLTMNNETPHAPVLLQMPGYTPEQYVNNVGMDYNCVTAGGKTMVFQTVKDKAQFHASMAAMMQLGKWFDLLRENGVYDNTKIILVADHGYSIGHIEELVMDIGGGEKRDFSYYYPLLMVKDFDAAGYTHSTEFMTNADVPTLATQGAVESPVNPFTGKPINDAAKFEHDQLIYVSKYWEIATNNGKTFKADKWASVHTDMLDKNNWTILKEQTVLKEHKLP